MADDAIIGNLAVAVTPNAEGFFKTLTAKLEPQAKALGDKLGKTIAESISQSVGKGLRDGLSKGDPAGQGAKQGEKYGSAFGDTLKGRLEAAFRDLPNVQVNADTKDVDRKLVSLREQLKSLSDKNLGIDLSADDALAGIEVLKGDLKELTDKRNSIDVRVNAKAALAELTAIDTELNKIDGATKKVGQSSDFKPLLTSIVALGPALIPLGAVAAASFGAFAEGAGVALLAVKGIKAEMKAGTPLGQQYSKVLGTIGSDFKGLEHTAAQGFFGSVSKGVSQLHALMPALNSQTKLYSGILGDAADHVLHGLAGGFVKLQPLFTTLLRGADSLAKAFDSYANGSGIEKFSAYVQKNLPAVGHALAEVAAAVAHLLAAGAGQGVTVLTTLGLVATAINAIPIGVLKALIPVISDAFIAFKLFTGVSAILKTVSTSVELLAVKLGLLAAAEEGAGAAGLATSLAALGPVAIPVAAVGVALFGLSKAFGALKKSQGDYVRNGDQAVAVLRQISAQGQVTSADVQKLGGGVTDFSKTIHSAFGEDSKSAIAKIRDFGSSFAPFSTSGEKAKNAVKSLDNGLSQLASGGGQKGARQAFKFLTDESRKLCIPVATLLKQFPKYSAVLAQSGLSVKQLKNANLTTSTSIADLSTKTGLATGTVQAYAAMVGISAEKIAAGGLTTKALASAVTTVSKAYNNASASGSAFLSALQTFSTSAGTSADRAQLLGSELVAANGDGLQFAGAMANASAANAQLAKSFDKSQRSAISYKKAQDGSLTASINYNRAGAAPLVQSLQGVQSAAQGAAQAVYLHEKATVGGTKAADDAYSVYKSRTSGYLIDNARKLGLTKAQADALAKAYFGIPSDVKSKIEQAGGATVTSILTSIKDLLYELVTGHPPIKVTAQDFASPKIIKVTELVNGIPTVKYVRVDSNGNAISQLNFISRKIAGLHGKTITINTAYSGTNPHDYMPSAKGNLVKAYAGGGVEKHVPQIAKSKAGTVRVWAEKETKGESYIPHAADSRRPRAHAIMAQTAAILGGTYTPFAKGGISHEKLGWKYAGIYYSSERAAVNAQYRADHKGSTSVNKRAKDDFYYRGTDYASQRAANNAQNSYQRSQANSATNIRLTVDTKTLPKFIASLKGTKSAISSATSALLTQLTTAARAGAVSANFVKSFASWNKKLQGLAGSRDAVNSKLTSAKTNLAGLKSSFADQVSSVKGAYTGSFNLGSIGQSSAGYTSVQAITNEANGLAARAVKFTKQLTILRKNGLSKALIAQLAEAGPDAAGTNVDALVSASKAQIAVLNKDYSTIGSAGTSAGTGVAQDTYGAGISAAQGLIKGLQSQETSLTKAIDKLADGMVAELKKKLKIHSPSKVMHALGFFTGQGFVNGLASHEGNVRKASTALVRAARTPRFGAAPTSGSSAPIVKVYIGEQELTDLVDIRVDYGMGQAASLLNNGVRV